MPSYYGTRPQYFSSYPSFSYSDSFLEGKIPAEVMEETYISYYEPKVKWMDYLSVVPDEQLRAAKTREELCTCIGVTYEWVFGEREKGETEEEHAERRAKKRRVEYDSDADDEMSLTKFERGIAMAKRQRKLDDAKFGKPDPEVYDHLTRVPEEEGDMYDSFGADAWVSDPVTDYEVWGIDEENQDDGIIASLVVLPSDVRRQIWDLVFAGGKLVGGVGVGAPKVKKEQNYWMVDCSDDLWA